MAPVTEESEIVSSTPAPLSRRAVRQRLTSEAATANTPAEEVGALADTAVTIDAAVAPAAFAANTASEGIDAFEQASRAFRVISEPVVVPTASASFTPIDLAAETPTDTAARRPRRLRRFVTLGATVGVMSLAGLLAVGMTLPAEAVAAVQATPGTADLHTVDISAAKGGSVEKIQAFVTSPQVENEPLARDDDYSTVSLVQVAAEQGIKYSSSVFTNDPNAAIQWPFKVGVAMSYGYGPRPGEFHTGIDFVPGEGAPIQAIADGTVRIATEQGGGYGVTVYIDHVIDGKVITSHYAHMEYGSLRVKAGDTVKVGQIVGLTGNTGHSYGAHLHFELIIDGHTIDPMPWLRTNAGRYSY